MEIDGTAATIVAERSPPTVTSPKGVDKAVLHQDIWQRYVTWLVLRQFEPQFLNHTEEEDADEAKTKLKAALVESRLAFERLFQSSLQTLLLAAVDKDLLAEAIVSIDYENVESAAGDASTIMQDDESKTTIRKKWHICFKPNIAVFYRADKYRIPSKFQPYMLSATENKTPVTFDTFAHQFETRWTRKTYAVSRDDLLRVRAMIQLVLLDDGLLHAAYCFCQQHQASYRLWKKNSQDGFGQLLDSLPRQFPFNQIYTMLAKAIHAL